MCGRYVIARAAGDLMADVDAAPGEPELGLLDRGGEHLGVGGHGVGAAAVDGASAGADATAPLAGSTRLSTV